MKRFIIEPLDKKVSFLPDEEGVKLESLSTDFRPVLRVEFNNEGLKKPVETPQELETELFVELMGVKAKGKKLGAAPVRQLNWLEPKPYDLPEEEQPLEDSFPDDDQEAEMAEEPETGEQTVQPQQPLPIDEGSLKPPPDFPEDDEDPDGTPVQMTLF